MPILTPPMISTKRLSLRAATADDAPALYSAFSDPEVMSFWSEPPHSSIDRTKAWLNGMISSPQNGRTDFIICLKEQVIGKIGIYRARPSNEIGFLLNRGCWGRGFAKEALTAMLDYLFDLKPEDDESLERDEDLDGHTRLSNEEMKSQWRYSSITADVDPRNQASIALLKKVGFVEGELVRACFQRGDEMVDSLYFHLERETWLARRPESFGPIHNEYLLARASSPSRR